jgi:hypothetical protein
VVFVGDSKALSLAAKKEGARKRWTGLQERLESREA